jgi:hypothetical protein
MGSQEASVVKMRPKAENFFIAMGLAVLYLVTPSLSYQFRQSFAAAGVA